MASLFRSPRAAASAMLARRPHDLVAAAIVEGDDEVQRAVVRGQRLGLFEQARADVRREPVALADDLHPDAVLVQFGKIAADEKLQQPHQVADFGFRPRPVFRRESVDGQPGDAECRRPREPSCAAPRRRRDGPATRGRPRAFAQRPLPSMMIATCSGVVIFSLSRRRQRRTGAGLNLHDLGFLAGQQAVDGGNRLVGQLLDRSDWLR